MKILTHPIRSAALACIIFSCLVSTTRAAPEDDAKAIWEAQGMTQEVLAKMGAQAKATIINKFKDGIARSTLPAPATSERLKNADEFGTNIEEAMAPDKVMAAMNKFLTDRFTPAELKVVAAFVATSAGKKFAGVNSEVKGYTSKWTQETLRPLVEEMRKKDNEIIVKYGGRPVVPAPSKASPPTR